MTVNHEAIGFYDNDEMLDAFLARKVPTESFADWYAAREKIARGLDHPDLPPVPDDELDDGDPGVVAKLKPKPTDPPQSAALALPSGDTDKGNLVLA
jgi:hypothetical protein